MEMERKPGFVPGLESLRGIAAAMVALLHVLQTPVGDQKLVSMSWYGLIVIGNGHAAVVFFFVLSGFVLSNQLETVSALRFTAARFARIYPAVWTTLLLFVAIYFLTGMGLSTLAADYTPRALLENFLLLRSDIVGVMWTLRVELLAVPIILALDVVAKRFGTAALVVCFLALFGLAFTGQWTKLVSEAPLLRPMYCFAAGMIAWHTSYLVKGFRVWWLLPPLVCFFAAGPLLGMWTNWGQLVQTISAAVIISLIAANDAHAGRVGLLWPPLRYLGRISYSFYLLHPLSLLVIWVIPAQLAAIVGFGVPPTALALALFVLSVAAVLPIAHLQYSIVERGGLRIVRTKQAKS